MMWYPGASLYYRKQIARPFYWLGFRIVRFADWVDGKQPRKRKGLDALPALLDKYDALLDKLKD